MEDLLSVELSIYKINKKYLGNIDLSNLKIENSSKETKFIIILDQSGSMGQSVPKIVNVIIPMLLNKITNQQTATLITFSDSSQVYTGDCEYFSKLDLKANGCTYMARA